MVAKVADIINLDPSHPAPMLAAAAIGGGLGVGGRTLKNLWDMWQDRDVESAVEHKLPKPLANRAEVPVEVTPEEAEELKRQGVHVKSAVDLGFFDKFMLGAAGTGAAALGWHAADNYFDESRLDSAKRRLQMARDRVQKLLGGAHDSGDQLGAAMKTAEDAMVKEAWVGDLLNSGLNTITGHGALGYPAGIGAALVAAAAFNEARKRNKALNNSNAIAQFARSQPTAEPMAELVPVVRKHAALNQPETNAPKFSSRLAALRERRGELSERLDGRRS